MASPPIAEVHHWLAERRSNHSLIDVAQAVSVTPPPLPLREHIARLLMDDGQHRYTPIRGLPALTAALAEHMTECYSQAIDDAAVVITAGCNQAFCSAVKALVTRCCCQCPITSITRCGWRCWAPISNTYHSRR